MIVSRRHSGRTSAKKEGPPRMRHGTNFTERYDLITSEGTMRNIRSIYKGSDKSKSKE